ncbi:unnamed protein product [Heterobilharzia americana]|nr:unnamed protein product [Heterobilharzia americana]
MLLSTPSKILFRLILERLNDALDSKLRSEQVDCLVSGSTNHVRTKSQRYATHYHRTEYRMAVNSTLSTLKSLRQHRPTSLLATASTLGNIANLYQPHSATM